MKLLYAFLALTVASPAAAQSSAEKAASRKIIQDEISTWNKGDAVGYSKDFARDGTFTNIRGQFFTGYDSFLKQHRVIFDGIYKNTTLNQRVISVEFLRPDGAVVQTVTTVSGAAQPPTGVAHDEKGRIRTRLLQIVAKNGGVWRIVTYHNTDVKPGIPFTEP